MPVSTPVRRRPSLRAVTAGVLAGTALLASAACSNGGGTGPQTARNNSPTASRSPPSSPAPTLAGVITPEQAKAVLARYVRINNQANALQGSNRARALSLNAQIEGNGLKAQSVAGYSEYKVWSAKTQAGRHGGGTARVLGPTL
jgi:hypothetical protein